MRVFSKLLGFLGLISIATIAGVSATFEYFDAPQTIIANQHIGLAEFPYKPEEVLPDDIIDTAGQSNHMDVIYELLFNSKMGMNSSKGGNMASNIENKGLLNYLDHVTGGQLKHLIDVSAGGKNLGFSLEYLSETRYYAYTYYRYDYDKGEMIVAYRTLFEKNTDSKIDENNDGKMDAWVASASVKGTATAVEYERDKAGVMQFQIQVDTWKPYINEIADEIE